MEIPSSSLSWTDFLGMPSQIVPFPLNPAFVLKIVLFHAFLLKSPASFWLVVSDTSIKLVRCSPCPRPTDRFSPDPFVVIDRDAVSTHYLISQHSELVNLDITKCVIYYLCCNVSFLEGFLHDEVLLQKVPSSACNLCYQNQVVGPTELFQLNDCELDDEMCEKNQH